MKYKSLWKDTWVEIRKSLGRFFSIFLIVAIGVAFFAGIKAGAPTMKYSADHYYDQQNLMDIKVMTSMGLTTDDIDALKDIKGVEGVYASYSMDALVQVKSTQQVLKVMSFPLGASKEDTNYINQPKLLKGRMPNKANECVVEYDKIVKSGIKIGDTITLTSGTDTPITESLKNDTYQVVGYITTPYYLSHDKGSSTIGTGTINSYVMIGDSNFLSSYYTEAYISVANTKAYNSYKDDAYFDTVEKVNKQIEAMSKDRALLRLASIKDEATNTLTSKIQEYDASKTAFEHTIEEAKQTIANKQQDIDKNKQSLENGQVALTDQKNNFEAKKSTLVSTQASLQGQLQSINTNINNLHLALQNPSISSEEKASYEAQLTQLQTGQQELTNHLNGIQETLQNTPSLLASKQQEIDTGLQALQNGQTTLDKAKTDLATQEQNGLNDLQEASDQIEKAKSDIDQIEAPTWYVLDRHSHYSFMDYGNAADRMDAIASVFPIFFFLVAALVCLTSMTRMVDEQRQQIGTLKALGYHKVSIAMKYIGYAMIASIFGGIFGALIGMYVFPSVIYNAWNIMYALPSEAKIEWQGALVFISIFLATILIVVTTLLACYKELSEAPSSLMRPKAPKEGKKILLERISFIWKHFSFTQKVTARNIFRYKKRFFMTIIGISGCTALILAGFGIRDSIGSIVSKQFGEIFKYDVSFTLKDNIPNAKIDTFLTQIQSEKDVSKATTLAIYHGLYTKEKEDKNVDLYVIDDTSNANSFFTFKNRISGDVYSLSNDGVLISEKLANEQNLSIGDQFKVDNGDGKKLPLKINGIVENYIGHNIYMTPPYYKQVYQVASNDTSIIATLKTDQAAIENKLGTKYMQNEEMSSVTFFSSLANSFENTVASLISVVIVLIISAGLLAFVVLYNLTTVNISERMREIATIKVLGFYDKEVSSYVYRENIFLTIIGSLFGLLLGIGLHSLIMSIAEMDDVMFGRNIEPLSFISSFLITMIFTILVNLVMYNKLKKILMVESLKSVE